ncbi:hypothetical protein J5Y04_37315 [Kitasatospora sp. RG8]|uniref:hypothetical protein n=1 Tax=Kitasatospora sp. RG8 TaxID=2820815 RepID=UPI001ADF4753|nr:hypothetical protein [Kitasatospora sp. RG8]MBP0455135.1 hypothetical protein [Kitasatospora sp. RG8]
MTRSSTAALLGAMALILLETIAIALFFCIAMPLLAGGIAFEDEMAPTPRLLPYGFLSVGIVMIGINGWAARGLWAMQSPSRRSRGSSALVGAGSVQVVLLGYGLLSGEHLFTLFAATVLALLSVLVRPAFAKPSA